MQWRTIPRGLRRATGAAALALMAAVLVMGSQPVAVGFAAPGWDKLVHLALHAVLAGLGVAALGWRRAGWVLLACAAFGALDEGLQSFYPGRSPSWADWAADFAGAVLALGLLGALDALMPRAHRDPLVRGR